MAKSKKERFIEVAGKEGFSEKVITQYVEESEVEFGKGYWESMTLRSLLIDLGIYYGIKGGEIDKE